MIDTHAHLAERFAQEVSLDKLKWVALSASTVKDSKDNLILAKDNKKLKPAVGVHPQDQISDVRSQMSELEKLINNKVVAIGECGLDFSEEHDLKKQEDLFRGQIELAVKYNKPLIVHSRKASDETIEILKQYDCRGVIHCYTGGIKRIKNVPESFYFGIDGNLTYESGLQEVVKNIPKNRLVLETDSPFLAPIPHRGETNKPEWVEFTYQKVAEIWGMNFTETEAIIDENAERLFQIQSP